MEEKYVVSIIIPVYNGSKFIKKAIDSVLAQKVNFQIEIIVIDDASTDSLESVLRKYFNLKNFKYIKNKKNLGVAESRNIGIKVAKGKYIAFLDADDWWKPEKLQQQIFYMEKKQCVLSCTGRELFDEKGNSLNKLIGVENKITYKKLLQHNSIACSSVVIKREVALEFPMKHSEIHEDYLMWLEILKKYYIAYGINQPLLAYRLTKNGKSRKKMKSAKMTFKVYRMLKYGRIKSFAFMFSHLLHGIVKYC